MKKRISLILLLVTIIITQISFMPATIGLAENANAMSQQIDTSIKTDVGIIPPAPFDGVENIQSSHFRNPGFEEVNVIGEPSDYESGGSTNIIIDSAYQTEVHSGSYGSYVKVEGTEQTQSYIYSSRTFSESGDQTYVDELLDLDFWYNCKANPDIINYGQVYVRFQIMSVGFGNVYMNYYLSSNTFPTGANNTGEGYFDIRGSLDSWININRNLTEDFISLFPAKDISQSYLRNIYFTCYSPEAATGPIELLFDDVSITNGTSFDYFSDNGDFEDGDSTPWRTLQSDAGYAFTSENDYTQGQKSMNMTAYSTAADSYSTAYFNRYHSQGYRTFPKGLFAQQSGEYLINFDWKYTDTLSSVTEYALLFLACENESFRLYINLVLGDSTDSMAGFTNVTGSGYAYRYIKAPDFSVRNTWNHFSIDYYDLITSLGYSNLATSTIQLTAHSEGTNARVQLLVDELVLLVYPLSDPYFENNWEWQSNDPLLAWVTNYDDNYVNITSDAYSGLYAANITSYGGVDAYCQRDMFLPVENNQFLDFRWKLNKITNTGTGSANSHIVMQIDEGLRSVYYVLGRTENYVYTNSSDRVCFYVDDYNMTGSWMNLYRNLSVDIIDVFGDNNWNITTIQLYASASGTTVASTIFDDLHFVEDNTGPTITNVQQSPTFVGNTDIVTVTADIVDSSGVVAAVLCYSLNGNPYTRLTMTYNGGNEYEATIPTTAYGTTVYYYIEAFDGFDQSAQGPSGYPIDYYVYDMQIPTLEVEAPTQYSTVTGDVLFNITAYDDDSGIAFFEITLNSTSIYDDLVAPSNYTWITTDYPNQDYTMSFYVEDNGGATKQLSYHYTVDNIPETIPTNVGALFSGLVSLSLVAISSTTIIYLSERRKKYLKRR